MTDGFLNGNFECFLLGFWLGSVDGLTLGPHEVIGLGKALRDIEELLPGKYDGIEIG